jgi:hypothetical protein
MTLTLLQCQKQVGMPRLLAARLYVVIVAAAERLESNIGVSDF